MRSTFKATSMRTHPNCSVASEPPANKQVFNLDGRLITKNVHTRTYILTHQLFRPLFSIMKVIRIFILFIRDPVFKATKSLSSITIARYHCNSFLWLSIYTYDVSYNIYLWCDLWCILIMWHDILLRWHGITLWCELWYILMMWHMIYT